MTKNTAQIPRIKPSLLEVRERETLKFIQVNLDGEPYLRIGARYHGIDLSNFLEEVGIDDFETFFSTLAGHIPAVKGERYELVGAGSLRRSKSGCFVMAGKSVDYNLGVNQDHIDKLRPYLPEGVGLKII